MPLPPCLQDLVKINYWFSNVFNTSVQDYNTAKPTGRRSLCVGSSHLCLQLTNEDLKQHSHPHWNITVSCPCTTPLPPGLCFSCIRSQPGHDISAQRGYGQLNTEVFPLSGLGLHLSGEFMWTSRKKSGFLSLVPQHCSVRAALAPNSHSLC